MFAHLKASSDVPAEESTPKDDPVKDVEESSPSQDIPTEPPTEDKTQVEPTPSDPEPSVRSACIGITGFFLIQWNFTIVNSSHDITRFSFLSHSFDLYRQHPCC